MNRRSFLGRGVGVLGAGMMSRMGLAEEMGVDGPPVEMLARTFGPLAASLLAAERWQPVPKGAAGWSVLPEDVRAALVKRAAADNNSEWPVMLATDELEFKRNGNRTRYEALSFNRRARLGSLAMGECVEGKGRFLDQIANGVWMICEETFWGAQAHLGAQRAGTGLADEAEPIIELFSAETAATLAWIVYLLGDALQGVSPLVVPRVRMEVRRRMLDVYLARTDFGWMGLEPGRKSHLNNWNPWINSNVLTATLLLETDAGRRSQLVAKVCRSTDEFLKDYSPDGACEEGPGYWSRSAASYFDVCAMLVSAHGGKGGAVLTHPFTRAMGHFIADVHIAKNEYVDFGDAHVHAAPEPEEMYLFGRATGDAALAEFGAFVAERDGLRLAKSDGGGPASLSRELGKVFAVAEVRKSPKRDVLVRDAWYPDLGFMAAREKEDSAEGFYVALQAASNGRPHGHNDSGSFLVYRGGEPVFIDVGVGTYTASTFNKERYTIWTMQSGFHNLPAVGGVGQKEGKFGASKLHYEVGQSRSRVSADLATAYEPSVGISRWIRTLTLDRTERRVVLEEDFLLDRQQVVTLHYMTAKEPVVQADGVRVGDAVLGFDAAALGATVEKIVLTDPLLKSSWGDAVWRVVLTTTKPVRSGSWRLELRGA